jgi:hypothetical protein
MKVYGGVDMQIRTFLTSTIIEHEWFSFTSRPQRAPGTNLIRGWVGPKTGLEDVEIRKILPQPGLELGSFGRPARSQSVQRLRHPGSIYVCNLVGFGLQHNNKNK